MLSFILEGGVMSRGACRWHMYASIGPGVAEPGGGAEGALAPPL